MSKLDIGSIISRDNRDEREAEKGDKNEVIAALRNYPKDAPKEFDDVNWEELMDPF